MSNFLKGYENLAGAKITGGLVLRLKLSDFERLKEVLKTEFPEVYLVCARTSIGKLWLKEGEEK